MAVSKVIYGTTTIVDLTDSTVTESTLLKDVVCYDKAGNQITGTYEPPTVINVYTGSTEPSSSTGDDNDLYLKLV